jgi:hypothetical protein
MQFMEMRSEQGLQLSPIWIGNSTTEKQAADLSRAHPAGEPDFLLEWCSFYPHRSLHGPGGRRILCHARLPNNMSYAKWSNALPDLVEEDSQQLDAGMQWFSRISQETNATIHSSTCIDIMTVSSFVRNCCIYRHVSSSWRSLWWWFECVLGNDSDKIVWHRRSVIQRAPFARQPFCRAVLGDHDFWVKGLQYP